MEGAESLVILESWGLSVCISVVHLFSVRCPGGVQVEVIRRQVDA